MLNPHIGYSEDDDEDEVWTTPTNKTTSSTTTTSTTATTLSNLNNSQNVTPNTTSTTTNGMSRGNGMMSSTDDIMNIGLNLNLNNSSNNSNNHHQKNLKQPYIDSDEEDEQSSNKEQQEDDFNDSSDEFSSPERKKKNDWLLSGEVISHTKDNIMYKMNMGNIYITNKRLYWYSVSNEAFPIVSVDVLNIYQTSISTSASQPCWKISTNGGDYLFYFQSKEEIKEINSYYSKSKNTLLEQNPNLKKNRQQQQQKAQQQQSQQPQNIEQHVNTSPVNQSSPPLPQSYNNNNNDSLYPNLNDFNINGSGNKQHQQQQEKKQQFNNTSQQTNEQRVKQQQQQQQQQQQYNPQLNNGNGNGKRSPPNNNTNNNNNNNHQNVNQNGKKKSMEEDFFSINEGLSVGDKGDSNWEEATNGHQNQNGYYDIEVKDPRRCEEDGQTFVTYEITGKLKAENGDTPVKTRRRYKEFEWLHQQLSQPSNLHVKVPTLPQKSMIQFWNKTDQTAVVKRCFQLDSYMKEISKSVSLRNHPATKIFMSTKSISITTTTFSDIINQTISTSTGIPGLNDIPLIDQNFIYNSVIERDYWLIRRLMKKWELLPKKLPFQKFLVVVLGTTSAGKSSFINNFFNIQVKRSAIGQLDTHFTLVETIPKDQFAQLSDKLLNSRNEKPRKFTKEELNEKITTEPMSDPRYGHVFLYMDTTYTLSRYDAQFSSYADIISKYGLVRSILINDEYLTGTDEEKEYQRRTIFLDSPGFESKKESSPESLLGNIKIIQFFYSTSDLTLFMMPAKNISLVSPQIQILEISVMYKLYGPEIVDQMVTKIIQQRTESKSFLSFPDIVKSIVSHFGRENRRPNQDYVGTLVWDKIRFLLTQIDDIQSSEETHLREQYFELGRLLGKSLTFLDPPTFTQCMAISLPLDRVFKSPEDKKAKCGDLDTLLNYIRSLNSDSSYHQRLEAAIQEMALTLQPHIQNSWKNYLDLNQWISSDYACVDQIRERSNSRLRNSNNSPHSIK